MAVGYRQLVFGRKETQVLAIPSAHPGQGGDPPQGRVGVSKERLWAGPFQEPARV